MRRALRILCAGAALLGALYFLSPLLFGILHIGMLYPAALLVLLAAWLLWPDLFRRLPRALRRWGMALIGAGLAVLLVLLSAMGIAAARRADGQQTTVIVLGCQVINNRPSVMLRDRIRAAEAYLTAHPEAVCVASGGMDDDEIITEAQCIRDELIRRGIAPERIYLEERSGSTAENLAFSADVIAESGLSPQVAIASDNFHQLRAAFFARRNGLEPAALGCVSVWYLGPGYWAREAVGVLAALVRGY